MASLRVVTQRFNKLVTDYDSIVRDAIYENKEDIIANNQEQMLEGENKDGSKIGEYSNESYANEKYDMNPKAGYGNKDLKYTGDFFRGFSFRFLDAKKYEVFSTDSKYGMLLKNYGPLIFGQSKESREKFIEQQGFRNKLLNKIKARVNL